MPAILIQGFAECDKEWTLYNDRDGILLDCFDTEEEARDALLAVMRAEQRGQAMEPDVDLPPPRDTIRNDGTPEGYVRQDDRVMPSTVTLPDGAQIAHTLESIVRRVIKPKDASS